ncbi:MAG: replication initiation protein [Eubacteriales bacterium]|nr:replication initiation protein [Eubacteriales bacterium]
MPKKIESDSFFELMAQDETLTRTNTLISAKYSATLLENKLTAWALKTATMDNQKRLSVSITTADIRKLTGVKGNGLYNSLKETAVRMIGRSFHMEEVENGKKSFKYINMIHYCEFKDGIFKVTFTPECADHLYNLSSNFTSINLPILFSLSSNTSYRLFELLSIKKYKIDKDNNPVPFVFSLPVLKLQLNCIDVEEVKVKKELLKENPDYDKIVNELATVNKFKDWRDFKRQVLNPAVKEINKKTDIFCSFDPIRAGRGGKVIGIRFYIQRNIGQKEMQFGDIINPDEEMVDKLMTTEEMEVSKLVPQVYNIMEGMSISQKDAIALIKAAEMDITKIQKAYDMALRQPNIKNLIGWMVSAIKDGYEENIEIVEGTAEKVEEAEVQKEKVKSALDDITEKAWQNTKNSKEYIKFEAYVQKELGMEPMFFELAYPDPKDKIRIFTEWMKLYGN